MIIFRFVFTPRMKRWKISLIISDSLFTYKKHESICTKGIGTKIKLIKEHVRKRA